MDGIKNKSITEISRSLRKDLTESEKILWGELRNRKFEGVKFLRQHPLFYFSNHKRTYLFIADFYCAEKKLVIELDGKIHDSRKEYDEGRDTVIAERGIKVIRLKNEELNDMEKVLSIIKNNF